MVEDVCTMVVGEFNIDGHQQASQESGESLCMIMNNLRSLTLA